MSLHKLFSVLTMAALATVSAVAQYEPMNPNATPEAKALLAKLYQLRGKCCLTGQHSYPLYSDIYMERVENLVEGSHPVVFGQDFGYSKHNSLDGINFRQRSIDNAIKWHKRGAIITFMWHAVPPTVEGNYTIWKGENGVQSELTNAQWKDLLTPGTEIHKRWEAQVDVIAFFLRQLQDENIPVIWRPYHEMNGNWFWWGKRPGKDGYQALYRMLYDRLTNYHHLNNLLWVFNANEVNGLNVPNYKDFFPGHDIVDILATDVYNQNYQDKDYELLSELANGKIIALGECGKLPTEKILKKQKNWSWFMCWSEFIETANEWGPRKELYDSEWTVTLEEFNK